MNDMSKKFQFKDKYPDLGTGPISVDVNISPEYFEQEKEKIFKHTWHNVCRAEEIANPGDYKVFNIDVLNDSIIVARGQDMEIRAFSNVCMHRGNKVALDDMGNTRGFACNFHSWTYDLEGQLAYVPDEDQFYELDKCALSLPKVTLDIWNGFVFIHPEEKPAESLHEHFAELNDMIGDFDYDGMELVATYAADVKCNWKFFIDAFIEAYHVETVHRRSVKDTFNGKDNPQCHLLDARLFERNKALSCAANPDHIPSPVEALAFKYGATLAQGAMVEGRGIPGTNMTGAANWAFDIHIIFPHFEISTSMGWYFTYHWWPVSENLTRWEMKFYMAKAKNLAEAVSQEFTKTLTRDTIREDLSTLENSQRMMETGRIKAMTLSDQEIVVRHNYWAVDQALKA